MDDHSGIKQWLAIIIGSLVFSTTVMFWDTGVTGMIAYDTGPDVDLNPDFVTQADFTSQATATFFFVVLLIGLQVAIYVAVTRFYNKLDEQEEVPPLQE